MCVIIRSRSAGSPAKALPSRIAKPGSSFVSSCQDRRFPRRIRNAASISCRGWRQRRTFIVASGSLPLGVPEDFYARVAGLAQKLGKRLVLDTSGAALKQAGHGIHLLKPSLRELQDLVGREIGSPFEQERAAREVIEQGRSEIVVLSLGAEGALLVTARGVRALRCGPGRGEKHGRCGRQHAGGDRSRSHAGAAVARGRALWHGGRSSRTSRVPGPSFADAPMSNACTSQCS